MAVWILMISANFLKARSRWMLMIATAILLTQTFWLLPALSERIDTYLSGDIPPASSLHIYFIALEVLKVVALLVFGYTRK